MGAIALPEALIIAQWTSLIIGPPQCSNYTLSAPALYKVWSRTRMWAYTQMCAYTHTERKLCVFTVDSPSPSTYLHDWLGVKHGTGIIRILFITVAI